MECKMIIYDGWDIIVNLFTGLACGIFLGMIFSGK